MPLKDSASLLSEAILAFVWRQWSQLGVAGYVAAADPWAADPEWLWAFSQHVAPQDGRLEDALQAWHQRNGHLLMPQRLKVAIPAMPEAPARPVGEDQGLRQWGGKVVGKALPPPLHDLPALAFKLRLALGVGIKAEVARALLTAVPNGLASGEVAEQVGLSRSGVWRALEEFDALGLVVRQQLGPKRVRWTAVRERWWPWLGWADSMEPVQMPWAQFFRALMPLWQWASDPNHFHESPLLASIAARKAMEEALIHWPIALAPRPSHPDLMVGEAYLPIFEADMSILIHWLGK